MSSTKDFLLPDLGEGLTEGEVVSWLVAVGDQVTVDQAVAEVETAKAVVEVPSPWAGTVTALHAEAGDEVEVGRPLITVDVGGSGDGQSESAGGQGEVPDDAEAADMVPEPDDETSGSVLVGYGTSGARRRRRRGAAASQGNGSAGASRSAEPGSPPGAAGPPGADHGRVDPTGRPLAKPPVRKLAKDLGVDLAAVAGSGDGGIITRDDVEAAAAPSEERLAATAPSRPAAPAGEAERIPMRGVRKAVAARMTQSRQEIPEATTWVDVEATGLWELRSELDAAHGDVRISPLAVIMRIVVAALRTYPMLNSRLDTDAGEIVVESGINLGFAAQTDSGLMVPVIHGAHERNVVALAAELNRLAAAARDRSVKPEEMTGGTFTVSNYGSFGVDGGNPVINHPEAAILGVGQIADRPWVVDGQLAVRKVLQLSIAFDHRICDGGEAAGFLRHVGDRISNPALLLGEL